MLGQESPYAQNNDDSDIEQSEDEIEMKQNIMTPEELEQEMSDYINKVLQTPGDMDIIMMDIRTQKHGQSLTNLQI